MTPPFTPDECGHKTRASPTRVAPQDSTTAPPAPSGRSRPARRWIPAARETHSAANVAARADACQGDQRREDVVFVKKFTGSLVPGPGPSRIPWLQKRRANWPCTPVSEHPHQMHCPPPPGPRWPGGRPFDTSRPSSVQTSASHAAGIPTHHRYAPARRKHHHHRRRATGHREALCHRQEPNTVTCAAPPRPAVGRLCGPALQSSLDGGRE